ncbi:MAG: HRDC domain-containing protein [Planctomycetes bacterium]|nr:HRDC domain-containing protein [Planctomycetota bacterium]
MKTPPLAAPSARGYTASVSEASPSPAAAGPRKAAAEIPPAPVRHWVGDPAGMEALLARLVARTTPWGLDIENTLTGLHHCQVALCQMSDGVEAWLIDPFSVDMGPILTALYAPAKPPVIVHDGSGDFIVLKRLYGVLPSNVIDTLLAAQQIRFPTPNLRDLAGHYLGIRLSKRAQHSNWRARPLSNEQLAYAALDAFVLPPLASKLLAAVKTSKKGEALASATAGLLESVREYETPERHPLAVGFAHHCRDRAARARLDRLLDWRTTAGNRGDVEALMNLSNKILTTIARANPRTLDALRSIARFSPRLIQRHGAAILECCRSGGPGTKTGAGS